MGTRLYPRLQGVRDDCVLGEAQHNKEGIGQFRSKNRERAHLGLGGRQKGSDGESPGTRKVSGQTGRRSKKREQQRKALLCQLHGLVI